MWRLLMTLLALAILPRLAAAQGVTTAAIEGTVTAGDGWPLAGATLTIVNLFNGRRWEVRTSAAGRFLLEDVGIGGPYRIVAFSTFRGQSLELTADLYNVLNLINRQWGLYRATTPTPVWPLLALRGYDTTAERGIYSVSPPVLRDVQDLEGRWSRWLLEVSVRYVF